MSTTATIGLGVVGLGRGFMLTLPALTTTPGIKLVSAVDLRAEAREKFSMIFDGRSYDSIDGLLCDQNTQAVYIASPHELHAEQTIAVAKSGKHVLVEKPMATSIADCRAMIEAARAAGIVLIVGPSHGFDAQVQRAGDLIASGRFGALRMITALNFTDFVYRPRRPEELDPTKGGGVIYSQASHQFDVIRRIADRPVTTITATSSNWDPARPGDGAYTALVNFTDGITASLTYSGYAHYDSDELMDWISELGCKKDSAVYGQARQRLAGLAPAEEAQAKLSRTFGATTKGTEPLREHNEHFGFVLASCERADLKIMADGIWVYGDERREFLPVASPKAPRQHVISEFLAAIRGERPTRHDGEWGLATMRCCAALIHSSTTGRTVMLDEIDAIEP